LTTWREQRHVATSSRTVAYLEPSVRHPYDLLPAKAWILSKTARR
jgi:hypothetical protein